MDDHQTRTIEKNNSGQDTITTPELTESQNTESCCSKPRMDDIKEDKHRNSQPGEQHETTNPNKNQRSGVWMSALTAIIAIATIGNVIVFKLASDDATKQTNRLIAKAGEIASSMAATAEVAKDTYSQGKKSMETTLDEMKRQSTAMEKYSKAAESQASATKESLNVVSEQVRLSQTLGQPFCAIQRVIIEPTHHTDEYEIWVVLKNSGGYIAEDFSLKYESFVIEFDQNRKEKSRSPFLSVDEVWKEKIIVLPEQELKHLLMYVNKKKHLEPNVVGYDKALLIVFTIEYRNIITSQMDKFIVAYIISKLSGEDNRYDAILLKSERVTDHKVNLK